MDFNFGAIFITAIPVIVVLAVILSIVKIVQTQEVAIVEKFGKYNRTLNAGLHFMVPFAERIVAVMNLKVRSENIIVKAKTKDNVFVDMQITMQYRVDENKLVEAYYKSNNYMNLATSFVQDALRTAVPSLTLDDVFARKDDICRQVFQAVGQGMSDYGYIIIETLITNVTPDEEVVKSMNSINVAQRERAAAQELAEAERVKLVTAAKAKAEALQLEGKGISDQRTQIIEGLSANMNELKAKGISNTEVLNLLLLTQYMNTIEAIGKTNNSKILFLPGGADSVDKLSKQIMTSIMATNQNYNNEQ